MNANIIAQAFRSGPGRNLRKLSSPNRFPKCEHHTASPSPGPHREPSRGRSRHLPLTWKGREMKSGMSLFFSCRHLTNYGGVWQNVCGKRDLPPHPIPCLPLPLPPPSTGPFSPCSLPVDISLQAISSSDVFGLHLWLLWTFYACVGYYLLFSTRHTKSLNS